MVKTEFKNEYGEKFILEYDGITVFMSGDEVNMMAKPSDKVEGKIILFNQVFSVWGKDELVKLGEALIELGRKK